MPSHSDQPTLIPTLVGAAGAHAIVLLGVKREDDVRLGFHTQWWPLQIVLWGVLVFLCFLMPNSVFSAYGQVAKARASCRASTCHSCSCSFVQQRRSTSCADS